MKRKVLTRKDIGRMALGDLERANRYRKESDGARRAAIRQLIITLGLLVDGDQGPPPIVKLLAASEGVMHATRFIRQTVTAEDRYNKALRIDHR